MKRLLLGFLLVFSLRGAIAADAAGTAACSIWYTQASGGTPSSAEIESACEHDFTAQHGPGYDFNGGAVVTFGASGAPGYSVWRCNFVGGYYTLTNSVQCPTAGSCSAGVDPDTGGCAAVPCTAGTVVNAEAVSSSLTGCLGGCAYAANSLTLVGGTYYSKMISTGGVCSGGDSIAESGETCNAEMSGAMRAIFCSADPVPPSGCFYVNGETVCPDTSGSCVDVGGETICTSAEQNCVVVGNQRVCAEPGATPENSDFCYVNSSGNTICFDDGYQQTDTSTTGTVTNPDGTTTTTTTNITHNNTTGGTTTTTTSITYDASGNEISRTSTSEDQNGGGDSGAFAALGAGTGPALELPALVDAQAALDQAWSDLQSAPVVAVLSGSAGDVPVGTCPTFSITLPVWGTVSTDLHCTTWDAVKGGLEVVMLALWTIVGVLIIASA